MNVYLRALGCRLNEAELENWGTGFQTEHHQLTEYPEQADLIVINTCAVTNEAVRKSRQLIRRSHRRNPAAKLVVTGCYASLSTDLATEISAIDLLVPNSKKDQLVEIVKQELAIETMPCVATIPGEISLFKRGRNRAFVKIQDGCRHRCTFCIVTIARGEEHSRKTSAIIDQIQKLQQHGIKEVVLTGVHVGGYGSDIGTGLYSLIKAILSETDIPRLRLASVEPWDLPDDFFTLFSNPRLMPHMHLPLQSGSDTVLKRMARRCKTADFARLVSRARQAVPGFNITTDIIVGFPGETDEDWQTSLAFIEEIGFPHIHVFPYSPRQGTPAAVMAGQIPPAIRKSRCQQLHTLAHRLKTRYLQRQTGKHYSVLFENVVKKAGTESVTCYGYTPNYLRVQLDAPADVCIRNEIKNVKILSTSQEEDVLIAGLT